MSKKTITLQVALLTLLVAALFESSLSYAATLSNTQITSLPSVNSYPAALLPERADGFDLTPYVRYWHDLSGSSSFQDALRMLQDERFEPLPEGSANLGFRPGTVWLKFALFNQLKQERLIMLEVDFAILDVVDLYCFSSSLEPAYIPSGDHLQYESRALLVRNFVFPLVVPPSKSLNCLLKVETTSTMLVPVTVSDNFAYLESSQNGERWLGLMYGIALALMIYNMVQAVLTRERVFLYFSIHVLGGVAYMTFMDGSLASLWIRLDAQDLGVPISMALGGASALWFSNEILELKLSHAFLHRFSNALALVTLLLAASAMLGSSRISYMLITGYMMVICLFLIMVGFRRLMDGFLPARTYLMGFGAVYIMVIWMTLNVFFVKNDVRWITYGVNVVWMFELILLSIVIHSRKRMEEFRRSQVNEQMRRIQDESRTKTDMVAKVSHEIRTPMTGILGLVELVQATPLSKDQKRYLSAIQNAGRGLLDVINDVLDFSRMEAGKLDLKVERFGLQDLLLDACALYEFEARRKGVELGCIIAPGTPLDLVGDRMRIRQVLLNTLSNALKHTVQGYVHINVQITDQIHADKLVLRFEVEDSGAGIDSQDQSRLFKSYSQVSRGVSHSRDSTGLGLVISQQLVKLMGGEMGVQSEPGKGSCFWFLIPMEVPEDVAISERPVVLDLFDGLECLPSQELNAEHREKHKSNSDGGGVRVLLVEDNEINQKVLEGFLDKLSIVPDLAENGRAAVDKVCHSAAPYDLILMDCEMPVMDGYEAASRILHWQKSNGVPLVPVVALSAHAEDRHRQMAFDAGMVDYLAKPVSFEQLKSKIEQYVDISEL